MPSVNTVEAAKDMRQHLTELGDLKRDFTFTSGYLRSLKLSTTYLKLIEPQKWTLRGESFQLQRPWE